MKHQLLGASGLRISEFCLGTLGFGESKKWGTPENEALEIINVFAEAGGSFIDTAPNYAGGEAERIVGRAVKGRREQFVIGTKFTASSNLHPLAGGNSRRSMMLSVEASLQRMNVDYIDLLWLHFWDGTAPLDEILRAADDCMAAGKIMYFGISNTPAWITARAATLSELRGAPRPVAIQAEYNLASRTAERELTPMAEALGMGVVAWGPLAAGALACAEAPTRRDKSKIPPEIAEVAGHLPELSGDLNLSPAQLALSWLRSRSTTPIPIIGARTKDQCRELCDAALLELNADLFRQLDELAPPSLGFPHDLIRSSYLRRFAFGDADNFILPERLRA